MKILCTIAFVLSAATVVAQIDSLRIHESPYSLIYNHLYYLQNTSYEPSRAALSIPVTYTDRSKKAIQLKQVLDGKGIYIDINRVPQSSNYQDSSSQSSIYVLDQREPLLYVEKLDNAWYYSRTTMEALEGMHERLYPLGTNFITRLNAPFWQFSLFGLKTWQYVGFILVLTLVTLLFVVINKLSQIAFGRFLKKRLEITPLVKSALLKISRIVGILISIRALLYGIPMLQFAPRFNALLIKGLNVLSIFLILLMIREVIKILFNYFDRIALKTENNLDDQLIPVVEKLTVIVVYVLGGIYMLDYLDVNVTALLAGISIGGLALALAAQDTVKNFFGSIMIFLDKPFQIGDWIRFKDVDGTVEEVGVRSTRIRTFANSVTYVPNAILADSVVDNMGLRKYRRFKTTLGVTYNTSTEQIDALVEGIREIAKLHPSIRQETVQIHMTGFGASAIEILVYFFFETADWTGELKAKHQILGAILKLTEHLGVQFAYPTQTIQVENMNGEKVPPNFNTETLLNEINSYFNKNVID